LLELASFRSVDVKARRSGETREPVAFLRRNADAQVGNAVTEI
jgi:hypothetical protein